MNLNKIADFSIFQKKKKEMIILHRFPWNSNHVLNSPSHTIKVKKVKLAFEPSGSQGPALISVFCCMKQLGVFLLPPGRDARNKSIAGLPPSIKFRYPFIHLSGERHCKSKVSCPRTQHNAPGQGQGQGSNPDHSIRRRAY